MTTPAAALGSSICLTFGALLAFGGFLVAMVGYYLNEEKEKCGREGKSDGVLWRELSHFVVEGLEYFLLSLAFSGGSCLVENSTNPPS